MTDWNAEMWQQSKEKRNGGYMLKAQSVEWETPQDLFDRLDSEFHFTLDPCATDQNAKCARFYTKEQDGLAQSWEGERVFMNPPYGSEAAKWVGKAYFESSRAEVVVALLPVRTDTKWFHDFCLGKAEIRFLKGRLKFIGPDKQPGTATFPSMLVIWKQGIIPLLEGYAAISESTQWSTETQETLEV